MDKSFDRVVWTSPEESSVTTFIFRLIVIQMVATGAITKVAMSTARKNIKTLVLTLSRRSPSTDVLWTAGCYRVATSFCRDPAVPAVPSIRQMSAGFNF